MTPDEKRAYCKKRGYSVAYVDYWIAHPVCEGCEASASALPHHIRTRGAGGGDEAGNLLALCDQCHRNVERGKTFFMARYPWLRQKMTKALAAPKRVRK